VGIAHKASYSELLENVGSAHPTRNRCNLMANTKIPGFSEKPGIWAAGFRDLQGFLITTYPTDAIKEGETIWQK
jgi:hypothetical protein